MRDRIPPGNRSPYEAFGQGGKIQRPPEPRVAHVQGCGDPTCQICMPAGRPQAAGGATPGAAPGVVTPADVERIFRDSLMGARSRSFDFVFADVDLGSLKSRSAFATPQSKAAAEEQRLRPSVERFFLKTKHQLTWDDVVGNEAARAALVDAVEAPVRHKAIYDHYGMRPTKGVLLYGPPGCGKTMFGKAAAAILATLYGADAARPVLLHINGPEIQSPYVGVTEELIRSIFAYARAYKARYGMPLVVFIDEADAILPSRSGTGGTRRALPWEESNVATFLTEMDGLEDSGAFVILATNRPTAIDEALLRDGRCDRKIKVARPDQIAATAILRKALGSVPIVPIGARDSEDRDHLAATIAEDLFGPFRRLARLDHDKGPDFLTMGDIVNGAMLVSLVEQAKAVAFRRDVAAGAGPGGLTQADLAAAVDSLTEQNRVLRHADALDEVADRIEGQVSVTPITAAFRRAA